ncbi:hypothetical protein BC829DRAFT_446671 [Chytridium lagenaria]|nr:hypothetical protein BC829DRAFT_446671 [Chytridium lagenaria]
MSFIIYEGNAASRNSSDWTDTECDAPFLDAGGCIVRRLERATPFCERKTECIGFVCWNPVVSNNTDCYLFGDPLIMFEATRNSEGVYLQNGYVKEGATATIRGAVVTALPTSSSTLTSSTTRSRTRRTSTTTTRTRRSTRAPTSTTVTINSDASPSSNGTILIIVGVVVAVVVVVLVVVGVILMWRRKRSEKTLVPPMVVRTDGRAAGSPSNPSHGSFMPYPDTNLSSLPVSPPPASRLNTLPLTPPGSLLQPPENQSMSKAQYDARPAVELYSGKMRENISTEGVFGWERDRVAMWGKEVGLPQSIVIKFYDMNMTGTSLLLLTDSALYTAYDIQDAQSRQTILSHVDRLRHATASTSSVPPDRLPPYVSS